LAVYDIVVSRQLNVYTLRRDLKNLTRCE